MFRRGKPTRSMSVDDKYSSARWLISKVWASRNRGIQCQFMRETLYKIGHNYPVSILNIAS